MKRLISLALVLALVFAAAGCSGRRGDEPFDTGLGLTVAVPEKLKKEKTKGDAAVFSGDGFVMIVSRESFDASPEQDLSLVSLDEYELRVVQTNGLEGSFRGDSFDNPHVTYQREAGEQTLFYYTTLRKGSDAFWLISFACVDGEQGELLVNFEMWADTIKVN